MDIRSPFNLLRDITRKSPTVSSDLLKHGKLSKEEKDLIRRIGISFSQLQQDIQLDVSVMWDRQRYTTQILRSLDHAIIAAAMRLYASCSTQMSPIHNASVWITSQSPKYQKVLSNLLDDIGIEEKIYDWAWSVGVFGDLFVEANGLPDLGIVSIDDSRNPVELSRIEHNGVLVGFYEAFMGQDIGKDKKIIEPWKYVHFRLLGNSKKNRPAWGDPTYSEYKTMTLMLGHNTRQASTRYGTSLILDALPTYRRLRMAEDSLLLARMTRGILRYLYLMKVDSTNAEMLGELIDQIANTLKRARAINTSDSDSNFQSRENPMGVTEDLFLPIPGNPDTDFHVEELGGNPDIRWIVDINELKQQLACALSTPLSLLGGYVDEATGSLGSEAIEQLDINFARNARRVQRTLINGIKRLCQIHLAYQNMDPDPALFEVCMANPSRAEEKALQENLETGTSVIRDFMDMLNENFDDLNNEKLFSYLNQKFLSLEDFDISDFRGSNTLVGESIKENRKKYVRYPIQSLDLTSFLPITEKIISERKLSERGQLLFLKRDAKNWTELYGNATIVEKDGNNKSGRQMTLEEEKRSRKESKEEQDLLNPI